MFPEFDDRDSEWRGLDLISWLPPFESLPGGAELRAIHLEAERTRAFEAAQAKIEAEKRAAKAKGPSRRAADSGPWLK